MAETALQLVKSRLGITSTVRDFYLSKIIKGILSELDEEHGLSISLDSPHHLMFVVDLATWRYQNKGLMEGMPRHLQYRLHKLIIASVKKNEKT